jgi:hypothetical protein
MNSSQPRTTEPTPQFRNAARPYFPGTHIPACIHKFESCVAYVRRHRTPGHDTDKYGCNPAVALSLALFDLRNYYLPFLRNATL